MGYIPLPILMDFGTMGRDNKKQQPDICPTGERIFKKGDLYISISNCYRKAQRQCLENVRRSSQRWTVERSGIMNP